MVNSNNISCVSIAYAEVDLLNASAAVADPVYWSDPDLDPYMKIIVSGSGQIIQIKNLFKIEFFSYFLTQKYRHLNRKKKGQALHKTAKKCRQRETK